MCVIKLQKDGDVFAAVYGNCIVILIFAFGKNHVKTQLFFFEGNMFINRWGNKMNLSNELRLLYNS